MKKTHLQQMCQWIREGYADAVEHTPGKRAPVLPEEALYMRDEDALPEVRAYWSGWDSGILDAMHHVRAPGFAHIKSNVEV